MALRDSRLFRGVAYTIVALALLGFVLRVYMAVESGNAAAAYANVKGMTIHYGSAAVIIVVVAVVPCFWLAASAWRRLQARRPDRSASTPAPAPRDAVWFKNQASLASRRALVQAVQELRDLLARPDNDFSWSSWTDQAAALAEMDQHLDSLRHGSVPDLGVLLAPTGPAQEVSVSSGWGGEYLRVATHIEAALSRVQRES